LAVAATDPMRGTQWESILTPQVRERDTMLLMVRGFFFLKIRVLFHQANESSQPASSARGQIITKPTPFRLRLNICARNLKYTKYDDSKEEDVCHKFNLLLDHHPCLMKISIIIISIFWRASWIIYLFSSF
jgi:hypothetical protein